jgi:fibronectin type 3 domain-containing protein
VQTAALTGACAAPVSHSVSLNWTASITPGVTYNVYRSTTSSGPWTKVSTSPVAVTTFSDNSVASARTYYYATTAVDGSGKESAYSNVATAVIP